MEGGDGKTDPERIKVSAIKMGNEVKKSNKLHLLILPIFGYGKSAKILIFFRKYLLSASSYDKPNV